MPREGRKVQTQLLVSPQTKHRLDVLAAASGYVRAEIVRSMIEAALPKWESRHAADIQVLQNIADSEGVTMADLIRSMSEQGMSATDLQGSVPA